MKDFELIEVFKAEVSRQGCRCIVTVKKYWADFKHKKVSLKFIEDNSTFQKWKGSTANFASKLRTTGECQVHIPDNEKTISKWVELKIKEAYGMKCEIKVNYCTLD